MKSIAVEAFGRHLKGTDAAVPFSLDSISENLKLSRTRNGPIPFLYPLGGSVGYLVAGTRLIVQVKDTAELHQPWHRPVNY